MNKKPFINLEFLDGLKFTPEQSLVAAVINKAWSDLTDDNRAVQRNTFKWFCSDSTDSFSFVWCAEQIGINYEYLRRFLFKNPEKLKDVYSKPFERHKKKARSKKDEAYIKASFSNKENESSLTIH